MATGQTEIIGDLEARGVTHLVLFSGYEWHGASFEPGSPLLDEYVRTRYREAVVIGDYAIWERI